MTLFITELKIYHLYLFTVCRMRVTYQPSIWPSSQRVCPFGVRIREVQLYFDQAKIMLLNITHRRVHTEVKPPVISYCNKSLEVFTREALAQWTRPMCVQTYLLLISTFFETATYIV